MATDVTIRRRCSRDPFFDLALMICASGKSLNRYIARDVCFGDSGGPMALVLPEGPRLFGVTSYITQTRRGIRSLIKCGNNKLSSVFTRAASVYDFIQANL
jgi:secreted trypsin-like serine protease